PEPSLPNACTRQKNGVARTVASRPLVPSANSSSADAVSSGAGDGLRSLSRACTQRTEPATLISASSACSPAPVMPPPGDSSGSVRQPPSTLFEFSLLLWASMCRSLPIAPVSTVRLSACIAGHHRRLCPTPSTTSARRQASIIRAASDALSARSEEHTSELQSRFDLVCRLLLER